MILQVTSFSNSRQDQQSGYAIFMPIFLWGKEKKRRGNCYQKMTDVFYLDSANPWLIKPPSLKQRWNVIMLEGKSGSP
jgi:hypothetical protein